MAYLQGIAAARKNIPASLLATSRIARAAVKETGHRVSGLSGHRRKPRPT
ncbi:MAG: hypothetical protein KGM60_00010 [Comamonadaceae bacterium]|nr:hypothetical protein [Comamonadaceae bacterium]